MFTIALCTYNGSDRIKQVVESILSLDSFDRYVNEVFLIDNASTDNTKAVCMELSKSSNKIKYIFEGKPGLANARRRALEGTGDWVIFVDDDNLLSHNWLTALINTIRCNPSAGIINGAIIAFPVQELDLHEEVRLKLMYRALACTHLSESNNNIPIKIYPVGAGMCVIMDAMKEVNKNGWLFQTGRKGNDLSSGEDTELADRILALGYSFVSNFDMKVTHLIPSKRLTIEYTENLIRALTVSGYLSLQNKPFLFLGIIGRLIKYFLLVLHSYLLYFSDTIYFREKIRIDKTRLSTFFSCMFKYGFLFILLYHTP